MSIYRDFPPGKMSIYWIFPPETHTHFSPHTSFSPLLF
jgi:hypothetical protein